MSTQSTTLAPDAVYNTFHEYPLLPSEMLAEIITGRDFEKTDVLALRLASRDTNVLAAPLALRALSIRLRTIEDLQSFISLQNHHFAVYVIKLKLSVEDITDAADSEMRLGGGKFILST